MPVIPAAQATLNAACVLPLFLLLLLLLDRAVRPVDPPELRVNAAPSQRLRSKAARRPRRPGARSTVGNRAPEPASRAAAHVRVGMHVLDLYMNVHFLQLGLSSAWTALSVERNTNVGLP